jgi:hypothetical protein
MWIRFCPSKRLLFRLEKTIDDDGLALSRTSPAQPRSFAIHYGRSTVYGHTLRIMKDNFAAIGIFFGSTAQCPSRSRVPFQAAFAPEPSPCQ